MISNQILEAVLQNTHLMAAILDPHFHFQWVNQTYADSGRHEPSFFIGKNHFDLYPHAENQSIFQQVVDTGKPFFVAARPFEFPDQPERGVTYWDWSLSPLKDDHGTVTCLALTLAEVTRHKQQEETLRLANIVFESALSANSTADANGRINTVNPAFLSIWGYSSKSEVIGKPILDFFLNPEEARAIVAALDRVGIWKGQYLARKKGGSTFIAESLATVLYDMDGRKIGYQSSVLDITERKQTEEALRLLNESLEERILERTAEVRNLAVQLRALAKQLGRTEQCERQRLAYVLHDHVQQLIAGACLKLGSMENTHDPALLCATGRAVGETLREAQDLCRTLTSEMSSPMVLQAGLVGGLRWLGAHMLEKYQFTVHLLAEAEAEPADEELRFQLFECTRELLFNALKHAGVSEAQVILRRAGPEQIHLVVSDQGAGFDQDSMKNRPVEDMSFGLFSIHERLADFGGRITIATAPGNGTTITLSCPNRMPTEPQRIAES